MKLYTVSILVDKKEIHQEFINSDYSIEELRVIMKPSFAEIEIKLVDTIVREIECQSLVEEVKKDYVEFSFDKDMTDEEAIKIRELMTKKDEILKEYSLYENELANNYYGLSGVTTKEMKMTPKPTIKKITFSGFIGISDLVSL